MQIENRPAMYRFTG